MANTNQYKRVLEDALKQLDWCIHYLHNNQQSTIARKLERNRDFIAKQVEAAGSEDE